MATATYDETYESLMRIVKTVSDSMFELGKTQGKNALGSEEELRVLILSVSKKILENLPVHQFEDYEDGGIEEMDSKYSHLLAVREDPAQFKTNDFEVTG